MKVVCSICNLLAFEIMIIRFGALRRIRMLVLVIIAHEFALWFSLHVRRQTTGNILFISVMQTSRVATIHRPKLSGEGGGA